MGSVFGSGRVVGQAGRVRGQPWFSEWNNLVKSIAKIRIYGTITRTKINSYCNTKQSRGTKFSWPLLREIQALMLYSWQTPLDHCRFAAEIQSDASAHEPKTLPKKHKREEPFFLLFCDQILPQRQPLFFCALCFPIVLIAVPRFRFEDRCNVLMMWGQHICYSRFAAS